jgi:hypothetical protein
MILAIILLLLFPILSAAQQCSQAQLNTEFTTDPTARTYTSCSDDQCVLDKFNAPCTDVACKVDQIVSREKIYESIDKDELAALMNVPSTDATAIGKRQRSLSVAMSNSTFNMGIGSVRQKLLDIFPAPSAPITNAAIAALQQKNVPRSQSVCGRAGTLDDVSCGLRGVECK